MNPANFVWLSVAFGVLLGILLGWLTAVLGAARARSDFAAKRAAVLARLEVCNDNQHQTIRRLQAENAELRAAAQTAEIYIMLLGETSVAASDTVRLEDDVRQRFCWN